MTIMSHQLFVFSDTPIPIVFFTVQGKGGDFVIN